MDIISDIGERIIECKVHFEKVEELIMDNEAKCMEENYLNMNFLDLCLDEGVINKKQVREIFIYNFKKIKKNDSSLYLRNNPEEIYGKIKKVDEHLAGIFIIFVAMSGYRYKKEKLLKKEELIKKEDLKTLKFRVSYSITKELKEQIKSFLENGYLKIEQLEIKIKI